MYCVYLQFYVINERQQVENKENNVLLYECKVLSLLRRSNNHSFLFCFSALCFFINISFRAVVSVL